MATGWLLAILLPTKMTKSLPIQSEYEQVVAAHPTVAVNPAVLGAWQTRALVSTWLVPKKRATFW